MCELYFINIGIYIIALASNAFVKEKLSAYFFEMKVTSIFFDLDGTVYSGCSAIAGAVEFIDRLAVSHSESRFLTNRSDRSSEEVANHLNSLGITCNRDLATTSAIAAAEMVKGRRVAVVGSENLYKVVEDARGFVTRDNPDNLLVGFDPKIDFNDIACMCSLLEEGVRFLATNGDKWIKMNSRLYPENGMVLAAIESLTKIKPIIVGKPNISIIDRALESIDNTDGSIILIGDNLETDTMAAQNAGLSSILILTGVTNEETADASDIKPTWRVRNYEELSQLVFSG